MTPMFISFQQLFTPVTKRDWRLYKTSIYWLKFWIKVFQAMNSNGSWQYSCSRSGRSYMYLHYEMESVVWKSPFNKSVQSQVIEQLVQRRCLPANPHNEFAVTGSDKRFSDSWLHSIKVLFADHVVLYYSKGLCCVLSGICYIIGRRRKRKGSIGPFEI